MGTNKLTLLTFQCIKFHAKPKIWLSSQEESCEKSELAGVNRDFLKNFEEPSGERVKVLNEVDF